MTRGRLGGLLPRFTTQRPCRERPHLLPSVGHLPSACSKGAPIGQAAPPCKTMMLTKLKAFAAALVLGVIAAGAIVSAQQPGGGRPQPSDPATKSGRPQAVAAGRGNLIVDWIPADGQGGKKEITVDPRRHCIHLSWVSLERDDRPNDGAVRVDLERGKFYKITAAGEAFMNEQTGPDADPFPGVVVNYPTDEQDGYAERQIVLRRESRSRFGPRTSLSPAPAGN